MEVVQDPVKDRYRGQLTGETVDSVKITKRTLYELANLSDLVSRVDGSFASRDCSSQQKTRTVGLFALSHKGSHHFLLEADVARSVSR